MNSNTTQLCILGYSGHGLVVAEALFQSGYTLTWYADSNPNSLNPLNLQYAGNDQDDSFNWNRFDGYVLGIGDNSIRAKVAGKVKEQNQKLLSAIHPTSIMASGIILQGGCLISAGAIINPGARIDEGAIINTGSIVEHECHIGAYAHVAPGAVLAGNVTIGDQSFIGANAVIKQGVTIGSHVTVGAGSVVLHDIPDRSTYVGNPAKPIKS